MPSTKDLDVVGVGNAIVDVLSQTEDSLLQKFSLPKGSMTLIEMEQAEEIYAHMSPITQMSGGSAANTLAALASLGGRGGYIGKVADDKLGKIFGDGMRDCGVEYQTASLVAGPPTARCMVLVTPDAQRTMCTYLGASVLISPDDIDDALIARAQITYLEGYLFDGDLARATFVRAAQSAHAAGRKVALTLSDSFCVERHRAAFLDLISNHVDLVFANEAEIISLYQVDNFEAAVDHLRGIDKIVCITRSEKGSVVVQGNAVVTVGAEPVERVIDTTGAGDLYAAGFLYGYTRGQSLDTCARIGSLAAAEIIQHLGARPQRPLVTLLQDKKVAV